EGAPVGRRAVARRRAPYRVRQAGELALHPAELPGVLDRPFLAVGDVHLDQITAVLRAGGVAYFVRGLVVELPDALGVGDRRVERDVGVALLRRPDDGLFADNAGDPHPRIGLLQRQRPRVHHAVLIVRALEAERAGQGPCLDDQIMRLLEALAVEGGVHAGRQLLLPPAAHKAGDQA